MANLKEFLKNEFMHWNIWKNMIYDVIIILIFAILALTFYLVKPHHMDIPLGEKNVNVMYPLVDSTVPSFACTIMAYGTPVILIILFGCIRKSPRYIVFGLLALLIMITMNTAITNMGKIFAGRPRPHFYARVAAGEENDAWKSFPSGHSSTIFSGMVYCSLLIAGQLKIFAGGHESWKLLFMIIPWFTAGVVAISRTRDYHHNFSDILGGALVGVFSALVVYFMKYKKIGGELCYQMMIERDPNENKDDDEENGDVKEPITHQKLIDNENKEEE